MLVLQIKSHPTMFGFTCVSDTLALQPTAMRLFTSSIKKGLLVKFIIIDSIDSLLLRKLLEFSHELNQRIETELTDLTYRHKKQKKYNNFLQTEERFSQLLLLGYLEKGKGPVFLKKWYSDI